MSFSLTAVRRLLLPGVAAATLAFGPAARAEIHIGVVLSLTGPGASLGIPEENALKLWTGDLAGEKVRFTVLNDNTDSTTAAKNTQKLITEEKVDLILGSSLTPPSLAVVESAGQAGVPVISLAGGGAIVLPQDGPRKWAFKLSPTELISTNMVIDHVLKNKGKTIATIGVANSYGDGFLKVTEQVAAAKGVKIVASEKYAPTDQSVTAQVVKILAANPDAVFIHSAGTPGALPQIELAKRGYKGPVYQTQGVANNDFLRVGGKDVEGTLLPAGGVLVAEQLPGDHPVKKTAMAYVRAYEAAHGKGSVSTFGAHAWDAGLLLHAAIASVGKSAEPGTPAYRAALRDALERTRNVSGAHGVFNMSPNDHLGLDQRARVMVKIENGAWTYQK